MKSISLIMYNIQRNRKLGTRRYHEFAAPRVVGNRSERSKRGFSLYKVAIVVCRWLLLVSVVYIISNRT